jgi:hypothetical protein
MSSEDARRLAALSAIKDALTRENEELRQQLEDTDAAALEEELEDLKRECEARLCAWYKCETLSPLTGAPRHGGKDGAQRCSLSRDQAHLSVR